MICATCFYAHMWLYTVLNTIAMYDNAKLH